MHRQKQENYTSNIQADLFYKSVGEEQLNQERKKAHPWDYVSISPAQS